MSEQAGRAGGGRAAMPRWVKVAGIVAIVVIVIVLVALLAGIDHGPGMHR